MTTQHDFRQLLGDLDFVPEDLAVPARETFQWHGLPQVQDRPELHEWVRLASDHEQPARVRLAVLFEPSPDGIYDIEWLIDPRDTVDEGAELIRGYRVSDGLAISQRAPFRMNVLQVHLKRNDRAVKGDAILTCECPSLGLDLTAVEELITERIAALAQAINATFKGHMGAQGQGGQVVKGVTPVTIQLYPEQGYDALITQITGSLADQSLANGDIVVISERVIAIAQGRLFPLELMDRIDPKTTDDEGREDLAALVAEVLSDVTADDLIFADTLSDWPGGPMATAGVLDPNAVAADIANAISDKYGVRCDVVIADTDTGTEVRKEIIGCVTTGATPIGATGGLVIYECMRVANAAEYARGSTRGIPIVICHPHPRRAKRDALGEHRGYSGRLDARRERLIGFA